ncbi:Uncharacterised protein [Xylophilus ampelinus]|nr:Uncharacterised protein [Xylophilus ampelinus]
MSFDWPCSGVMRRGRDVAPAGDLLSFASPKESRQRKGDPAGCDPSLRCGQPAPRRCRGALQNSLRALRCARTAAASQSTKQLLPHAAQLPPRHRHVAGASRRDPSERAIASLGLRQGEPLRGGYSLPLPLGEGRGEGTGRWMRRVVPRPRALTPTLSQREREPSQAEGQGCAAALLTRFPCPSVCAEERSGWREKGRACLSEASLRGPRQPRAPQVARSEAEGRKQWGRLFFADFLLAKQKKVRPPPGGVPGSCLGKDTPQAQQTNTGAGP